MRSMSATQAKNKFGELIDMALQTPTAIRRSGRNVVVVMSHREYTQLKQLVERVYMEHGS